MENVLIGDVTVTGFWLGPTNVKIYGRVPPVETVTCKTPFLDPHVVPVVDAVTV